MNRSGDSSLIHICSFSRVGNSGFMMKIGSAVATTKFVFDLEIVRKIDELSLA